MDGEGDGSSSGEVSLMAADEGPRADPELTQPNASPAMDLSLENVIAHMRLYARAMLTHMVQLDTNMEADNSFDFVVPPYDDGDGGDHPRHGDGDGDAGDYDDEYGSFVLGAVPASSVAIACLPETTVGEESGQCAVCLEEYEAGDTLRNMPCAHGFHERCIFKWLHASRRCPLCRFALPAEENTETDEEDDEREAGHHNDDDALEYL